MNETKICKKCSLTEPLPISKFFVLIGPETGKPRLSWYCKKHHKENKARPTRLKKKYLKKKLKQTKKEYQRKRRAYEKRWRSENPEGKRAQYDRQNKWAREKRLKRGLKKRGRKPIRRN